MIDCIHSGKFEIPVLFEDNHLLIVVKPANLPTQGDSSGDLDLLTILKDEGEDAVFRYIREQVL